MQRSLLYDKLKRYTATGWIVLTLCVVPACKTDPQQDLQAASEKWSDRWADITANQQSATPQPLAWTDAVSMIESQNLNIISAEQSREDAKRRIELVWRSLLPFVRARIAVTTTLDELDSISFDDVRIDLIASGFLQSVFTLPPDLYAARLNVLGSCINYERVRRQQIVACYAYFAASADLDWQDELFDLIEADLKGLEGERAARSRARLRAGRARIVAGRAAIAKGLAVLLNDFSAQWQPEPETTPSADAAIRKLKDGELRLEESLAVQAIALNDIATEAAVDDAWREYLPTPNIFLSSPPLYSRNSSGSDTVDIDDFRQTSSIDWILDTRGFIGERYLRSQIAHEMAIERSKTSLSLLAMDLDQRRNLLDKIDRFQVDIQKEQALIRQAMKIAGPERYEDAMLLLIELRLRELDIDKARLDVVLPVLTLDPLWETLAAKDAQ